LTDFLFLFFFFFGLFTSGALIGLWVAGRCVSAGIQWIQHEMGSVASGQGFSKGGKTLENIFDFKFVCFSIWKVVLTQRARN